MLPNLLKKGDTIGIIAPSDPIEERDLEAINQSILLVESLGLKVKFGKHAFSNPTGYGATAKQKAQDINQMFEDPEVACIICAKGGNNSNQTFAYLDYDIIKKNPKIICGFSDTTSLTNMIYAKTGLVTYSSATFKAFTSWETEYGFKEFVKRFIEGSLAIGEEDKEEYQTICQGCAEGILVGGNLSLFTRMLTGTYQVDVTDKILFLEDLGWESEPAAISSYFYYLQQNKVWEKIKGIWLGNYTHDSKISMEQILMDTLEEKPNFPIIKSENFGHIDKKTVIPIGTRARIDTNKKIKIELIEPCVQKGN